MSSVIRSVGQVCVTCFLAGLFFPAVHCASYAIRYIQFFSFFSVRRAEFRCRSAPTALKEATPLKILKTEDIQIRGSPLAQWLAVQTLN